MYRFRFVAFVVAVAAAIFSVAENLPGGH